MLLMPWAAGVNFLHREMPFPAAQVQETIVSDAAAHVVDFRKEGEDLPGTHCGQVANPQVGLMRVKLMPGAGHICIPVESRDAGKKEQREKADQPQPIHKRRSVPVNDPVPRRNGQRLRFAGSGVNRLTVCLQ